MTPTQRAAYAYKILRSDLGRRAADEGWHVNLWDFVFGMERAPEPGEMRALKDMASEHYGYFERLPDAPPWNTARAAVFARLERLRRAAYECD